MGSRERVAEYLSKSGLKVEMRVFDESTRNSALAAQALGCTVAEIAKSVVFVGMGTAVVIVSGDMKVDTTKLTRETGEEMRIATPVEVKERTGFPIGGVAPFPHNEGVLVFPDVSLGRFNQVWAAAGTPNAVFRIGVSDLLGHLGRGPFDLATAQG
jgi:prolyl-tRNA editing enzyme YbaK/EbsC (Cys-tRNA(Pro) deacylase)